MLLLIVHSPDRVSFSLYPHCDVLLGRVQLGSRMFDDFVDVRNFEVVDWLGESDVDMATMKRLIMITATRTLRSKRQTKKLRRRYKKTMLRRRLHYPEARF